MTSLTQNEFDEWMRQDVLGRRLVDEKAFAGLGGVLWDTWAERLLNEGLLRCSVFDYVVDAMLRYEAQQQ